MDFSEDAIDRACEEVGAFEEDEVVPNSALPVELQEALWMFFDSAPLAEVLEEIRKGYTAIAVKKTGSRKAAQKAISISNTTFYRIARGGNKF